MFGDFLKKSIKNDDVMIKIDLVFDQINLTTLKRPAKTNDIASLSVSPNEPRMISLLLTCGLDVTLRELSNEPCICIDLIYHLHGLNGER
jgi:hypothetical protein